MLSKEYSRHALLSTIYILVVIRERVSSCAVSLYMVKEME